MLHGLSAEIVLCKKYQQNENREMRMVKTPKNKQNLFSRSPLITSPVLHRQLTNLLINSILFFPVSRYLVLHQSNGEWSISIYAVFGLVFGWPVTCSWACIWRNVSASDKSIPSAVVVLLWELAQTTKAGSTNRYQNRNQFQPSTLSHSLTAASPLPDFPGTYKTCTKRLIIEIVATLLSAAQGRTR